VAMLSRLLLGRGLRVVRNADDVFDVAQTLLARTDSVTPLRNTERGRWSKVQLLIPKRCRTQHRVAALGRRRERRDLPIPAGERAAKARIDEGLSDVEFALGVAVGSADEAVERFVETRIEAAFRGTDEEGRERHTAAGQAQDAPNRGDRQKAEGERISAR